MLGRCCSSNCKKENWKTILDLGTGSGCIAIALAKSLPQVKIVAVDISPKALAVASKNAITNKVADRVSFVFGDLFTPLEKGQIFDAIVSNPLTSLMLISKIWIRM